MSGSGAVTVSRGVYEDEVLVDGFKHTVVCRAGQYLVLRKGERWPDVGGDHGSTRDSRENAMSHFNYLEAPFYEEE
jgi:hypothetical protein